MEGASEEGGAQERLGEDDTVEDDTREGENGRFLGAEIEEKRMKREESWPPKSRGTKSLWV